MPLPVVSDKPRIRPSRAARWRAAVLVAVHLLIAAHIAHWLAAGETVTPVEPSEAMAYSKASVVNAGLIFFAATILLTAVFGRFFCGWACHLVALQDLCRWLLERAGIRPAPLRSRLLGLVPMIAFAYMFLWPVAYRLWTGDSFAPGGVELTTSEFWATFPGWAMGGLTFLVCGFAIVYFLGAKGFCTYACPYGAIFGAAEKLAPFRIRVTDACAGCGHCTAVCTSNVRVHEEVREHGMVVDSGCMKCQDCVSVCPNGALYYGFGPLPRLARSNGATSKDPVAKREARRRRFPLAVWEEILLAAAFAAAFFTFRGLYGAVPFLLSLGLAAILAFLVLVTARLVLRPHLAFKGFRLKRDGRLLAAGRAFVLAMAALTAFWAHSAFVHLHAAAGERAFQETLGARRGALDFGAALPPLLGAERRGSLDARGHLETAETWGLAPAPGQAAKLAWLALLAGDSAGLERWASRALGRGERPAEMWMLLARDAQGRGDAAATARGLERALAAEPGSAHGYLSLGTVLAGSGDLAGAERAFARGIERAPGSPELVYNAGLTKALLGKTDEAIALVEEALRLRPDQRRARELLADLTADLTSGGPDGPGRR